MTATDPVSERQLRRQVARVRRVRLLELMAKHGRPATAAELRWLAERDTAVGIRKLAADLYALVELGLVSRRGCPGRRADYSPTPTALGLLLVRGLGR